MNAVSRGDGPNVERGRSAADPWVRGRPPHLPAVVGDVPKVFLLPGDPARVDLTLSLLAGGWLVGQTREFRLGIGHFDNVSIGVCSTGIGGPSTEIALVELARMGVETVIRVGGMGSFRAAFAAGSVFVVDEVHRSGGTAAFYASGTARVAGTLSVRDELLAAAKLLKRPVHRGVVLSSDSYYVGQGRWAPHCTDLARDRLEELKSLNVDGLDMEAETVLTVGSAIGLKVGAVLGIHANRATDDWCEEYEPLQVDVVMTALTAAHNLHA